MAAELLVRRFLAEITPNLFPTMGFLGRARNDDAFVNAKSVELPHAGASPNTEVDRSSFPAPISERSDSATQYFLEELTSDPTHIRDVIELQTNYNKRASVLEDHAMSINTRCVDRMLYKWAATAGASGSDHIVPTTGSGRAATGPAQTGNRKAVQFADLKNIFKLFLQDDIPLDAMTPGVAVVTPDMWSEIIGLNEVSSKDFVNNAVLPNGSLGRFLNFDWYVRSRVTVLNSSDELKSEGAAGAAGDQNAGVFYHPNYVRRAKGGVKVYLDTDKPEYYGSIFSVGLMAGGAPARNDNKGVVLLYEDAV